VIRGLFVMPPDEGCCPSRNSASVKGVTVKTAALLATSLVTLSAFSACEGRSGSSSPVAPSPAPVVPSPVSSPRGQVFIRSATPEPGGTLLVRDCTYDVEESGPKYQMCAPALMIFDVAFDSEIAHAAASANFYRGSQLCASGAAFPYLGEPFTAGTRASFRVNIITIVPIGKPIACPLPAETTRMVVELADGKGPLLTQEFAHTYAFVER
jgi:hypothetical protein